MCYAITLARPNSNGRRVDGLMGTNRSRLSVLVYWERHYFAHLDKIGLTLALQRPCLLSGDVYVKLSFGFIRPKKPSMHAPPSIPYYPFLARYCSTLVLWQEIGRERAGASHPS